MKLKQKVLIAFLTMVLLPAVIIGSVCFAVFETGSKRLHAIQGRYDFYDLLYRPSKVQNAMTQTEYNELCSAITADTNRFFDRDWFSQLNDSLTTKFSYLVIIEDSRPVFVGDEEKYARDSEKILQAIAQNSDAYDGSLFINTDMPCLVKHRFFTTASGSEGMFIIVSETDGMVNELKNLVKGLLIFSIAVIVTVAVLLTLWLNKGLFRPLEALREATKELGNGNLNYKLERKENDEIRELCDDFEEMRRHLKTQIEQKERYEQDVREMISNVSHDLKTPITAIKGYAEGMMDGVADNPEKRDKYLRTIILRATDMTMLVDELSYYSKLDNNKLPYTFEKIQAVPYFGDCAEEYSVELSMEDFTVNFETFVDSSQTVTMDCEQIKRVMNNLVGNAVKYRNKDVHGEINIKLTDAGDSVRISVTDNGIGISKESLPHIFDRFYRADKSRTSGRAGTGIGLAIVKKIVVEHGGRVFAKSELMKGTTISFTLKKGA